MNSQQRPASANHWAEISPRTPATDNLGWAERAQYWSRPAPKRARGRPRLAEQRQVLILSGHGVTLRVEQGALVIQNGFTHYPQPRERWRLFPGDPKMPPRIVLLDTSGYLSFDALTWLAERNIPLIRLDWQGHVTVFCGLSVHDPALHIAQLKSLTMEHRVRIAKALLTAKFTNCTTTLNQLSDSRDRQWGLHGQARGLWQLTSEKNLTIQRLEHIEAIAAKNYFRGFRTQPIRWKGIQRHPIPDEWFTIGSRKSRLNDYNFDTTHPVNAMLNYAYRVVEAQTKIAIIAAGLDPTIGFLHVNRADRDTLVYDLMEPLRPQADAIILNVLDTHELTPNDFVLTTPGVCRLHPALAKRIASEIIAADLGKRAIEPVLTRLEGRS